MKHLHHFNFNSQELLQCPHCNQYLPKSNHDFGPNYQEPVNRCYCHCACCQHRNDKQNNQEQAQNRPLLSVNYHKSHLLVERIKTGIESLMYSLLYAFVLFLFFCLCLSFISCGNDKTASDYQKSALEKNHAGEYEAAILDCNKAIALNENYAEPYNNRGWAEYNLARYNDAIADFTKAMELNQKFIKPIVNRGNAYLKIQKYEAAEADFDYAIKLNPSYKNAYQYKGNLYKILGRSEEAEIWYAKAK